MKLTRVLVVLTALVLVASCKIRIIVPVSGNVTTVSEAYSCSAGEKCDIDVVDIFFDETFVAEPKRGYTFKSWWKADRRFCGGSSEPCRLFTSGFEGDDNLMSFLETDEVFYLQPVFKGKGWFIERKSEAIGTDTVTAVLVASVKSTFFAKELPEIWLRCQSDDFSILINWRDLIDDFGNWDDSDHYVKITDENDNESLVIFNSATTHTASFVPRSFRDEVLDAFRENSEMTFEIGNSDHERINAIFKMVGFESAYQEVAEACSL